MRSLIMARCVSLQAGCDPHPDWESEPVVVDTDNPRVVVLELDDGHKLELDSTELIAAIDGVRSAA